MGGSNPWEREEKERQVLRRQEAARIWIDEQIGDLEALGPAGRTAKQEEQLRTLKVLSPDGFIKKKEEKLISIVHLFVFGVVQLEAEFRKRAQEAAKDDDDDEDDDDDDDQDDQDQEEDHGSASIYLVSSILLDFYRVSSSESTSTSSCCRICSVLPSFTEFSRCKWISRILTQFGLNVLGFYWLEVYLATK